MFFDDSDSDEENTLISQRRTLRDNSDPLSLSENEFRQYFRLSREAFKFLLDTTLFPPTSRSTAIPAALKLAATLNLLASGSYQVNVGGSLLLGMAQPTVSLVFNEVIPLLERTLCEKWIKLDPPSFREAKKHFFDKFKIPGVVGYIDGTHIPILRPTQDEHMYFNRKGFHSINAMIITDHNYRILAINPCYGGAAHDSFVWSMSDERDFFEENFQNGESRLLGDSGYGLAPWLLTPYRVANNGSGEETFNTIHSSARCSVERSIGVLKARWRCLSSDRKLRYSPDKTASIINVCCALQNICIAYNIHYNFKNLTLPEDPLSVRGEVSDDHGLERRAQRIRDSIRDSLLT